MLPGPHLVLADSGDDVRVALRLLVDRPHDVLRQHAARFADVQARVLFALIIDPLDPLGALLFFHKVRQPGEHVLRAAHDRHSRREVLADLRRVDIDVDDLRGWVEVLEAAHRAVIEAHADADHDVRLIGRHVGVEHAVHAQPAVAVFVRFGEPADSEEGSNYGDVRLLRKFQELLRSLRPDDAVPGDDDRPLGLVDQLRRLADHAGVALDVRLVAAQADLLRPFELVGLLEDVLGDIDEHRPRPSGSCDVRRLADRQRDFAGVHHEVVVLGDRLRDAGDVRFLESVFAEQRTGDVAGQREDGCAVHPRGTNAGHEVCRARPAGAKAEPHAAAGAGVAVRHVGRALFVPAEDVPHPRELGERVVEREDDAAGIPEHRVHAFALEGLQHHLSASHARHKTGSFLRSQDSYPARTPVRGRPAPATPCGRGYPWSAVSGLHRLKARGAAGKPRVPPTEP